MVFSELKRKHNCLVSFSSVSLLNCEYIRACLYPEETFRFNFYEGKEFWGKEFSCFCCTPHEPLTTCSLKDSSWWAISGPCVEIFYPVNFGNYWRLFDVGLTQNTVLLLGRGDLVQELAFRCVPAMLTDVAKNNNQLHVDYRWQVPVEAVQRENTHPRLITTIHPPQISFAI